MRMNVRARVCVRARVFYARQKNRGGEEFFVLRTRDPCIMIPLSLPLPPTHPSSSSTPFLNLLWTSNLFQLVRVKKSPPRKFVISRFSRIFLSIFLSRSPSFLLLFLLLGEVATPPLDIISSNWTTNNREPPFINSPVRRAQRANPPPLHRVCVRRAHTNAVSRPSRVDKFSHQGESTRIAV